MRWWWLLLAVSSAQAAVLSGVVHAPGGAGLEGVEVLVQSETAGLRWKLETSDDGRYATPALKPGRYKVTVRMAGFRTITRSGIDLEEPGRQVDFDLDFLVLRQMITVVSRNETLDPSGGSSLHLSRLDAKGANLPSNIVDFRSTFDLVPGVATVAAANSDGGQFTANGQRPNANSFRVDGLSVNTGIGGTGLPGSFPGASLPATSGLGTTGNLVSADSTADVELHTYNFAPEFGERPGAESFVSTRSGENRLHATVFGHYRDRHGTAPDWFANSRGLDFPRPFYNTLGFVASGPVWPRRAFFFVGADTTYLRDSGVQVKVVPSVSSYQYRSDPAAFILGSFIAPTGRDLGDGFAEAVLPLGRTGRVNSFSGRFDVPLNGRHLLVGRSSYSITQFSSLLNILSQDRLNASRGASKWVSTSGSYLYHGSEGTSNELRFQYSRSTFSRDTGGDRWTSAFGASSVMKTFADNTRGLLPFSGPEALFSAISIPGAGQFISQWTYTYGRELDQAQLEIRDTAGFRRSRHQFRFGADVFRITPSQDGTIRAVNALASNLDDFLASRPLPMTYSLIPQHGGSAMIGSLFAQDTFALSESVSLLYGVRWELTPPVPGPLQTPLVSGAWTGSGWLDFRIGVKGAAPWNMSYGQFAPRVGLAWRLPTAGLVMRAGAGVFFDTRLGPAVMPVTGGPYNSWQLESGMSGVPAEVKSGSLAGIPSSGAVDGEVPELRLPRSYQWRMALEREAGRRGVISAAYVGSAGRHLTGSRAWLDRDLGVVRQSLILTENSSSYNGLQVDYSGLVPGRISMSSSYTWSHSIDDGSLDSATSLVYPGFRLRDNRASSNFDLRQSWVSTASRDIWGFVIGGVLRVRGGFPLDVMNAEQPFGRRFENAGRPDLVAGQPLWIDDGNVGGGRRLNDAAFADPAPGRLGSLSRNAFRGFGQTQLDVQVQRAIRLPFGVTTQIGVSAYNVLNHPNFADPVGYRSSHWFGQSTSMQNVMLGLGAPNGGVPTLFQTGGARAVELSVHVSF